MAAEMGHNRKYVRNTWVIHVIIKQLNKLLESYSIFDFKGGGVNSFFLRSLTSQHNDNVSQ